MPYKLGSSDLHRFQRYLIGTWSNAGVPDQGKANNFKPFSYNIMPLPQEQPEPQAGVAHHGYILKNFTYREVITFHDEPSKPVNPDLEPGVAPPGAAPNRGFQFRQVPHALFYDQVVRFAEGPAFNEDEGSGEIVHIENGVWLHLMNQDVVNGPYPDPPIDTDPPRAITYAKQISVPHGNSILALGTYSGPCEGRPAIHVPSPLPEGIDTTRYRTPLDKADDYENPDTRYTLNPAQPLETVIEKLGVTHHHHVHFQTMSYCGDREGHVTNIPFERKRAAAVEYEADYWLMSTDGGSNFDYLAYSQNIPLRLRINGEDQMFPHITVNVIKRQA